MSRQKSISHEEALRQAYAANPMQAVEEVLELARQANELEDRVKKLELENAALKRELAGEMEKY